MSRYRFEAEQLIEQPVESVFPFFENPRNLDRLTPPSLGFKIKTPEPIRMQKGTIIDYTIRIYGIPVNWQTQITEYEANCMFVDTQIRGPYKQWVHRHCFYSERGGTRMTDEVQYEMPLGPFGELARVFFVENEIKKIFAYRKTAMEKVFKGK